MQKNVDTILIFTKTFLKVLYLKNTNNRYQYFGLCIILELYKEILHTLVIN